MSRVHTARGKGSLPLNCSSCLDKARWSHRLELKPERRRRTAVDPQRSPAPCAWMAACCASSVSQTPSELSDRAWFECRCRTPVRCTRAASGRLETPRAAGGSGQDQNDQLMSADEKLKAGGNLTLKLGASNIGVGLGGRMRRIHPKTQARNADVRYSGQPAKRCQIGSRHSGGVQEQPGKLSLPGIWRWISEYLRY